MSREKDKYSPTAYKKKQFGHLVKKNSLRIFVLTKVINNQILCMIAIFHEMRIFGYHLKKSPPNIF